MSAHHYRVVVEGELGPRYASAFDGMTVSARNGTTEITGPIIDSAHLQGLLERIAGLGLTVHSLNPLDAENGEAAAQTHTQPAGVNNDPGTTPKGP
jgi:hypothetical protein